MISRENWHRNNFKSFTKINIKLFDAVMFQIWIFFCVISFFVREKRYKIFLYKIDSSRCVKSASASNGLVPKCYTFQVDTREMRKLRGSMIELCWVFFYRLRQFFSSFKFGLSRFITYLIDWWINSIKMYCSNIFVQFYWQYFQIL